MTDPYTTGTRVKWPWGDGTGSGTIQACFTDAVSRTIKGSEVRRNASADNPAYLIEQEDGDEVLKSHSELRKA